MKTRNIILTIAAAAVLAAPAAAIAQGGPGSGGGPGGGPGHFGRHHGPFEDGGGPGFLEHALPRLTERLGLSDEQVENIEAIVEASRPEIEAYAEQLRANREAYRESQADPTVFDEQAFRAHAAEQSRIQTEMMVSVQRTKAAVFAQLTPEQLEQLENMRGSGGGKAMRRHGGRRSS
jgi:Spy/CpxP family protein refolding chaperone